MPGANRRRNKRFDGLVGHWQGPDHRTLGDESRQRFAGVEMSAEWLSASVYDVMTSIKPLGFA